MFHRALLVALIASGCSPLRQSYEPRRASGVAPAGCYERERIELATGVVTWTQAASGGTQVRPTSTGWEIGYGPATYLSAGGSGLVAYAGGERLDAGAALQRLGDSRLARDHQRRLELTAGAGRWYPIYRTTSIGAAIVGAPLTLVGSGLLLFDDSNAGAYTALVGLSVLGVSALAHLGSVLTGPEYARHERDRRLISDRRIARRAAQLALDHNRRIAARCHATPDLPMTDRARRLLEPPGSHFP